MLFLSVVDDRPTLKYLNGHVREDLCSACAANPQAWKDLGRALMPNSDAALGTIAGNANGNIITCCSGLFQLWLDRQPKASWRQLITALEEAKLENLAAKIQEKLEPSVASTLGHTTTTTSSQMPSSMTSNAR